MLKVTVLRDFVISRMVRGRVDHSSWTQREHIYGTRSATMIKTYPLRPIRVVMLGSQTSAIDLGQVGLHDALSGMSTEIIMLPSEALLKLG